MFRSFFPQPKLFFSTLIVWAVVCITGWYTIGDIAVEALGLSKGGAKFIGVSRFWSGPFLWFYFYYLTCVFLFAAFWWQRTKHEWLPWSILGSALILFITSFQVQVTVVINEWYGPFYNKIQKFLKAEDAAAVSVSPETAANTTAELYGYIVTVTGIILLAIAVRVFNRFFVSHWVFRWRTAMNDYYTQNWSKLRHIEGASQRVQEDTMRFANIAEGLGVAFVDSILTLLAFLPVLWMLSESVPVLPFIGEVPRSLVYVSIFWALFGTALLGLLGVKLPGLEFNNQKVEAALRKELVLGEEDPKRASIEQMTTLFGHVRKNYFTLYFHYLYFNVGRFFYILSDGIFAIFVLIPSIALNTITLGSFTQISNAFSQVRESFQFVVNSWPTIIELISIYKRLKAFESVIDNEPLPEIDKKWLEDQNAPAQ